MYLMQVLQSVTAGPHAKPSLSERRSMERNVHTTQVNVEVSKRKASSLPGYTRGFHGAFLSYASSSNEQLSRKDPEATIPSAVGTSDVNEGTKKTRVVSKPKREYRNTVTKYVNAENGIKDEKKEEKKKGGKWSIGGFFKRKKKVDSGSESSSEDEAPRHRGFLAKRKMRKEKQKQKRAREMMESEQRQQFPQNGNIRVTVDIDGDNVNGQNQVGYMLSSDCSRLIQASDGLRNRVQSDGIQRSSVHSEKCRHENRGSCENKDSVEHTYLSGGAGSDHGKISRISGQQGFQQRGSHDSLNGSIDHMSRSSCESTASRERHRRDSNFASPHGGSSSSLEGLNRKDRREHLKARVEALREKYKNSSSDEDSKSVLSLGAYHSEESLHKEGTLNRRTRAARTERYMKRLTREEYTSKRESESDSRKKTREIVQKRISKIEKEAQEKGKMRSNKEAAGKVPPKVPKWAATVVYQESSEFESSYMLKTPSATPSPVQSPLMTRARDEVGKATNVHPSGQSSRHMKKLSEGWNSESYLSGTTFNPARLGRPTQTLQVPQVEIQTRRSMCEENNSKTDLLGQRSKSYESNINRAVKTVGNDNIFYLKPHKSNSFGSPCSSVKPVSSRTQSGPPPPPPRDPQKRLFIPSQENRPSSYSFENGNQHEYHNVDDQGRVVMERSPSIKSMPVTYSHGSSPSSTMYSPKQYQRLYSSDQQLSQKKSHFPVPNQPSKDYLRPPSPQRYQKSAMYSYTDRAPVQVRSTVPAIVAPQEKRVQYYTDLAPRSRKPIQMASQDYPYMSDSQINHVTQQKLPIHRSASDFWRQKEQAMLKQKVLNVNVYPKSDSSRSSSPRVNRKSESVSNSHVLSSEYPKLKPKMKPPPLNLKPSESLSSLSGQSDVSSPRYKSDTGQRAELNSGEPSGTSKIKGRRREQLGRPLSMVMEKSESVDKDSPPVNALDDNPPAVVSNTPPTPPVRKYVTRCGSAVNFDASEKGLEEMEKNSSNFEDALSELEAIYQSLKLDDEDLFDRAERRDLPVIHQKLRDKESDALNTSGEVGISDVESVMGGWNISSSFESLVTDPYRYKSPSQRRSGVIDKRMDDMAYRRLHHSERNTPDVKDVLSKTGSYLLISPALSPATSVDMMVAKPLAIPQEPDTMYDDVTFRNMRQANSIKIIEPQPPFGIPLGPTSQAADSDYMHAQPKNRYRSTFKAMKFPDNVRDDLAYRNLRKDLKDPVVNTEELDTIIKDGVELKSKSQNLGVATKKKRAVRSLSANIASMIRLQNPGVNIYSQDFEKAQSITDLPESMENIPKEGENKENMNKVNNKMQTPRSVKHRNEMKKCGKFADVYNQSEPECLIPPKSPARYNPSPSWVERANLVDVAWNGASTSTETLTDSRANLKVNSQPDLRMSLQMEGPQTPTPATPQREPNGGQAFIQVRVNSGSNFPSAQNVPATDVSDSSLIQAKSDLRFGSVTAERKAYPVENLYVSSPKPFYKVPQVLNASPDVDKYSNVASPTASASPGLESRKGQAQRGVFSSSQRAEKLMGKVSPLDESRLEYLLDSLSQAASPSPLHAKTEFKFDAPSVGASSPDSSKTDLKCEKTKSEQSNTDHESEKQNINIESKCKVNTSEAKKSHLNVEKLVVLSLETKAKNGVSDFPQEVEFLNDNISCGDEIIMDDMWRTKINNEITTEIPNRDSCVPKADHVYDEDESHNEVAWKYPSLDPQTENLTFESTKMIVNRVNSSDESVSNYASATSLGEKHVTPHDLESLKNDGDKDGKQQSAGSNPIMLCVKTVEGRRSSRSPDRSGRHGSTVTPETGSPSRRRCLSGEREGASPTSVSSRSGGVGDCGGAGRQVKEKQTRTRLPEAGESDQTGVQSPVSMPETRHRARTHVESTRFKAPEGPAPKVRQEDPRMDTSGSTSDKSDVEKRKSERIARYKEERKRALARKYGEWSSSEDLPSIGEEPSYMRYSRRKKKKEKEAGAENCTVPSSDKPHGKEVSANHTPHMNSVSAVSPEKKRSRFITRESSEAEEVHGQGQGKQDGTNADMLGGMVRSTRASRLRAAAAVAGKQETSTVDVSRKEAYRSSSMSNWPTVSTPSVPPSTRKLSLETLPSFSPQQDHESMSCNTVPTTPMTSDSLVLQIVEDTEEKRREREGAIKKKEKDKSSKRKSNLNRAMNVEEVTVTSDSPEETPRRSRRRRTCPGQPTCHSSSVDSSPSVERKETEFQKPSGVERKDSGPLLTPDIVRNVQTQLITYSAHNQSPVSSSSNQSFSFSSLGRESGLESSIKREDNPCIDRCIRDRHREKSGEREQRKIEGACHSSDSEKDRDLKISRVPPKLAPLKKPEIPEILKPKQTGSLASPGTITNPPSGSPSKSPNLNVDHKPPPGPDVSRSTNLRLSLRKTLETGTNFMLAKRNDKKDEKIDIFKDLRLSSRKNSKEDITEVEADALSEANVVRVPEKKGELRVDSHSLSKSLISGAVSIKQVDVTVPELSTTAAATSNVEVHENAEIYGESTDDITARIEALTAAARDTVAKVDRLASAAVIEDSRGGVKSGSQSESQVQLHCVPSVSGKQENFGKHFGHGQKNKDKGKDLGNHELHRDILKQSRDDLEEEVVGHGTETVTQVSLGRASYKENDTGDKENKQCAKGKFHTDKRVTSDKKLSEKYMDKDRKEETEKSVNEVVKQCEEYLSDHKCKMASVRPKIHDSSSVFRVESPMKSVVYISQEPSQKNCQGGSEGNSEQNEQRGFWEEKITHKPISHVKPLTRSNYENTSSFTNSSSTGANSITINVINEDKSSRYHHMLKKYSQDDVHVTSGSTPTMPLLKHRGSHSDLVGVKMLSQPSEPPVPHGILKKKCSVDETEVRVCSPELMTVEIRSHSPDPKTILKHQRRSSFEDTRTHSPEPLSILKWKSSREEIDERPFSPEPAHGILKRKASVTTDGNEGGEPKPILKKKSSAEEIESDQRRPILKKKSSTDDELDDRPKSILKTSRKSQEDIDVSDKSIRCEAVQSPILKIRGTNSGGIWPDSEVPSDNEKKSILKTKLTEKPHGILKKRETSASPPRLRIQVDAEFDRVGEKMRPRSDSAPEVDVRREKLKLMTSSSSPFQKQGILKKRAFTTPGPPSRIDKLDGELNAILRARRSSECDVGKSDITQTPKRQVSPLLGVLSSKDSDGSVSLTVAERVKSMEEKKKEQEKRITCQSPTSSKSSVSVESNSLSPSHKLSGSVLPRSTGSGVTVSPTRISRTSIESSSPSPVSPQSTGYQGITSPRSVSPKAVSPALISPISTGSPRLGAPKSPSFTGAVPKLRSPIPKLELSVDSSPVTSGEDSSFKSFEEAGPPLQRSKIERDQTPLRQPAMVLEFQQNNSPSILQSPSQNIMDHSTISASSSEERDDWRLKSSDKMKCSSPLRLCPDVRDDKRERRHKTLPVTPAEVAEASALAFSEVLLNRENTESDTSLPEAINESLIFGRPGSPPPDQVKLLLGDEGGTDNNRDSSEDTDNITKLSVSAKASLFMQLEYEQRLAAEEAKKRSPKGGVAIKRFQNRRDRTTRPATQPVTTEEVQEAARLADSKESSLNSEVDLSKTGPETAADSNDEEPSKLTLAERVSLFNKKMAEERLPPKPVTPAPVRRRRVISSRFQTQPITIEEVEKAQKISPLAASLTKPPDPEILGTLPIQAARDLMYKHGEEVLSRPGSRASSRPTSRATSRRSSLEERRDIWLDEENKRRGILKREPSKELKDDGKSILRPEMQATADIEVRSILKGDLPGTPPEPDCKPVRSVLKKESSYDEPKELKSILKPETDFKGRDVDSSSSSEDITVQSGHDLVTKLLRVEAQARKERELQQQKQMQQQAAQQQKIEQQRNAEQQQSKDHQYLPSSNDTADEGSSSSGGREVRKIIKNEAVARRRNAAIRKQEERHSVGEVHQSGGSSEKTVLQSSVAVVNHSQHPCDRFPSSKDHGATVTLSHASREAHHRGEVAVSKCGAEVASEGGVGSTEGRAGGGEVVQKSSSSRRKVMQRSHTQPLTDEDRKSCEGMAGGSITERLLALQKSGKTEWKKRLATVKAEDPESDIRGATKTTFTASDHAPQEQTQSRDKNNHRLKPERRRSREERPSSITVRLNLLETSQLDWRKRVNEQDATKFTVAGKMGQSGTPQPTPESPMVERKKRTPKPVKFRSKTANLPDAAAGEASPLPVSQKEKVPVKRCISAPEGDTETIDESGVKEIKSEETVTATKVQVPRADNDTFQSFFEGVSVQKAEQEAVEIAEEDFDKIISQSRELLAQKRTVKLQRRKFKSRNPVKVLAARTDLQEEYEEQKTGVAEKELKRIKVERMAKNSSLAVEALAGLASKEDFTAIALKKSSGTPNSSLMPYKDLMLLQVKGRRHVQTRLVEPCAKSINSGDTYVLVTPDEVYNWIGRFSNVIERAKGAEIALHIQQKRDLGCKSSGQVFTVEEEKVLKNLTNSRNFWKLMRAPEDSQQAAGPPEEDEFYEASIIDTNMIFEAIEDELVPVEDYWGSLPRIEMLDKEKVLVFDFGSELYIWNGKMAPFEKRKSAMKLARELWEEGYDYSECDICPLQPSLKNIVPKVGSKRPSWALLGKVNQHMETILFREKFLDWPDMTRIIRTKEMEKEEKQVEASLDLKPYNAALMIELDQSEPDLELEGSHLGRGVDYFDEQEKRHFEITTLGLKVWHILEYDRFLLPDTSWGQFHSGDTYVVRWLYMVTMTGRDLSGQMSKHSFAGRERCAYFFWQGKDSTINEKGASALMTVELDEERGPQIRVVQGREPPAFLNCWEGKMVVHMGEREEEETNTQGPWKMYMIRGEKENEAVLVEIPCGVQQLRSRSSFVLLNIATGVIHIWHGAKSQRHTRQIIMTAVKHLKDCRPLEVGFHPDVKITVKEQYEGAGSKEFWEGLGGGNRQLYMSLLEGSCKYDYTPRLFHMTSWSGEFTVTEVLCTFRSPKVTMPYPFLQTDLYKVSQPALFLLDNHYEVWLWQGWWPEGDEENDNTTTGSSQIRWNVERRCAMETAIQYCSLKRPKDPPKTYLISAGLEPMAFTNLFPEWTNHDEIAESNIKDGKKPGEMLLVTDVLSHLNRSTYTLAELQERPLPDGVDPSRVEGYLADEEFEVLFSMTKDEYYTLPQWKQTNIKKEVGLF